MDGNQRFTIAVVDDDESFCEAVVWLLSSRGFVAKGYNTAETFLECHPMSAMGCTVMDLRLGGCSGLDAFLRLRSHGFDMPVVMISAYGDISTAVQAVQLGAMGWLEKPVRNEKLIEAVQAACAAHEQAIGQYGRGSDYVCGYSALTAREKDIFWRISRGLTAKQIALELGISHRTVETHRNQISAKMGIASMQEVASAAYHLRHVRPDLCTA